MHTASGKDALIYPQSGVVPYFRKDGKLKLVLITSRSGAWSFPKGLIEPGMTAAQSAAKEALEEAGVEGNCSAEPFASYEYEKWKGVCHVEVFGLEVTQVHEDWEESYKRIRKVVAVEKARELIKAVQAPVLQAFLDFERQLHAAQ